MPDPLKLNRWQYCLWLHTISLLCIWVIFSWYRHTDGGNASNESVDGSRGCLFEMSVKKKRGPRSESCFCFCCFFVVVAVLGGKLRGSLGKLPEFPVTVVLGMCLLTHGHHVHCGLRGRLCKNNPWAPFHGLLHPGWFGKKRSLFWPSPCLLLQITPPPLSPVFSYHLSLVYTHVSVYRCIFSSSVYCFKNWPITFCHLTRCILASLAVWFLHLSLGVCTPL